MTKLTRAIALVCPLLLAVQIGLAQDPILNSLIKTISPVETSATIKRLGIQYDGTLLNATGKNYGSDFKKALNLGVYSTDLGYANINDRNIEALQYVTAVKKEADGLQLGQFIDVSRIISLAANKDNLNKLLEETSTTFENMSSYLQDQNRSNLAALILTGGFVETLYITCEIAEKFPANKELTDRIVEQKLILGQLLTVLSNYQNDQGIARLTSDLRNLNQLFSKYNFEHTSQVTTTQKTIGGIEVVVVEDQGSSPDIEVSPQELATISNVVGEIRNAIVQ